MLSPPNHSQGAPAPSLTPPFVLGQYHVVQKIGQGGMGSVYRALHPLLKKEFAVKILPPEATADGRAVARFRREMEAIGRLDHHHIVRATDAGEAGGVHFLVMEFVDGIDLSRLVRFCAPLPVADACELVRQAALGLQCAHEHGLVHRDVKPSNLVLSRKGEVKVLDLGLALLSRTGPGSPEMTVSGQVMGTADYMAPEQWEASHDVDIRADVYSLGCTLYTLLVGRPPFAGGEYATPLRKMAAHAGAPVLPVASHRDDVPAPLEALLARMMAKAPAGRPATPAEVARALGPFAGSADLSALAERALVLASPGLPAPHDRPTLPETGRFVTPSPEAALPVTPSLVPRPGAGRKRRAIAIVAAATVLTIALAVALWLRHGTEDRTTTGAVIRPVDPHGWQRLLAQQPGERLWVEKDTNSFIYKHDRQTLLIYSKGYALLRLGETNARGFRLEVGFDQPRWTGGFGVYFGGHEGPPPDWFRCQMIDLRPPPGNAGQFSVWRSVAHIPPHAPGASPPVSTDGVASVSPPQPLTNGEKLLELEFNERGLVRVRWDGAECPALVADTPVSEAYLKGADYRGEFGIYCVGSDVTVKTARFQVTE